MAKIVRYYLSKYAKNEAWGFVKDSAVSKD